MAKFTSRVITFKDHNGRYVNAIILGGGDIPDAVAEWCSNNPDLLAEVASPSISDWMAQHITQPTDPVVDSSLSVTGAAADAKKTGDEISDLKSAISGGGLTAEIKQALLNCFNYVAWKNNDPNAQDYIDDLEDALYPPADLSSISAVYTQSGTVYNTDSLDDLRSDLVVTAHYDDYSTETVTNYVLSGSLTVGTSTITVTYGGKTTTFTVQVTNNSPSWILGKGFNQRAVNNDTYLTVTTSATRAVYVKESADYEQLKNDTAVGDPISDSGYYPIAIPANCTGIEILSPADVYVAAYDLKYNSAIGFKWKRLTTTGWINPATSTQFTFDSNATHFDLACKHGSAGTATVTQNDVNGISITYLY